MSFRPSDIHGKLNKFRLMLVLGPTKESRGGSILTDRLPAEASSIIDEKYPHLGYGEMYPYEKIPPEVDAEYARLLQDMIKTAQPYVMSDDRMGTNAKYELICVEFDLSAGSATLLKCRPKTTESGHTYQEWYNDEQ